MNKQEVIKEVKTLKPDEQNLHEYQPEEWEAFKDGFDDAKCYAELAVEKLEEPEKPVVPQYVADWYEDNKRDFENQIYTLCISFYDDALSEELYHWFVNSENEPIQTLVKMKLYGYEVEKEKLYTVKFANEDFGKIYIGIFKKANKIGLSTLPMNNEHSKCYFTESELKKLKFWNNPAFDVNEVKE